MIIAKNSDPQKVLSTTLKELRKGSSDSRHPFRYLSLATFNAEANEPDIRMVVLREITGSWSTIVYTDARTSKVEELKKLDKAALLFWHDHHKIQVTLKTKVKIHQNDEVAEQYWAKNVHGPAQKAYTPLVAPGTVILSPEEAHSWPEEFHPEHFCALECMPYDIQILQINGKEHRRLSFLRNEESDSWQSQWVAP